MNERKTVTQIVDEHYFNLLEKEDKKWIKRILDGPRREADAHEAEEENNSYYNNPLGSG